MFLGGCCSWLIVVMVGLVCEWVNAWLPGLDGFWVVEENWKFAVVSSRCDKSVRATLIHCVPPCLFTICRSVRQMDYRRWFVASVVISWTAFIGFVRTRWPSSGDWKSIWPARSCTSSCWPRLQRIAVRWVSFIWLGPTGWTGFQIQRLAE